MKKIIILVLLSFISCNTITLQGIEQNSQKNDDTTSIDTLHSTLNTTGFRYYKLIIDSINLGGPNCGIITETSFKIGNNHIPTPYTLISNSNVASSNIPERDIPHLFDGDITTGTTHGKYIKFEQVPWQWTIDLGSPKIFTSLLIASHQTSFYKEPSHIKLYGSNNTSSWKLLCDKTLTQIYQTTTIPLSY